VDGRSVLALLKAPVSALDKQDMGVYADGKNVLPVHAGGMGWMYNGWQDPSNSSSHAAFRYGQWKYVHRSKSCEQDDCMRPMLFDLSKDLGEYTDVSDKFPAVFAAIQHNFSVWYASVLTSITDESQCTHIGPPAPPAPPPAPAPPSSDCTFKAGSALDGGSKIGHFTAATQEACCALCRETAGCAGGAFHPPAGCVLRHGPLQIKPDKRGSVCIPKHEPLANQQQNVDWVLDETDTQ